MTLLEYRNKSGTEAELLADAEILRAALPIGQVKLILDDRADLVEQIGFDGVHVDAGDVPPAEAGGCWVRIGSWARLAAARRCLPGILAEPAGLFLHRPGFSYPNQADLDKPPIGIEGVRRLREQAGPGPVLVAVRRHYAGHGG